MSTRAVYTFREAQDEYHVYKHSDGYPSGACTAIENALSFSWALPRFEVDEFAAGFVAGNKTGWKEYQERFSDDHYKPSRDLCGGGVRLLHSGNWHEVSPGDIQYRYEIFSLDGELYIRAFGVSQRDGEWTETSLFSGPFTAFQRWSKDNPHG